MEKFLSAYRRKGWQEIAKLSAQDRRELQEIILDNSPDVLMQNGLILTPTSWVEYQLDARYVIGRDARIFSWFIVV